MRVDVTSVGAAAAVAVATAHAAINVAFITTNVMASILGADLEDREDAILNNKALLIIQLYQLYFSSFFFLLLQVPLH